MRWTRSRNPIAVIAVVMGLAAGLMLSGCGAQAGTGGGGDPDKDASLRIAYPVTQSLDPHEAAEPAQLLIATWPVYDRLIQVSADAEYEPMLATDWTFSKDGKTLTLKLREGVTFSDGTPFDADAVKANLDDYRAAKGTMLQSQVAGIADVTVVDDHTVDLALTKPSTTVLTGLSSMLGGIMISPKALKSGDLSSNPVGTGAYVVESFKPGQEVVYKRRTDKGGIWDDKTGGPAEVTITTMATDAQVNAIKSGQIDLTVWSQSVEPFQSQIDAGQLTHTVMDGVLNMVGVNFNKTKAPFDDPLVRQAVNLAVDRQALVDAFMPDSVARVQPWPDGMPGFDASREDTYGYDPDKAEDLLAQAGYDDGVDAGEMLVANAGAIPQAAEVIQSDLEEVGIDIKIRTMDTYALVSQWAKAGANAELMYMSLPAIDSYGWLGRLFVNPVWTPGGPDKEMAGLVEAGIDDPTASAEQTGELVGKAIDYATDQALYAPMWQGVGGFVSTPNVQGLEELASVNGGVADFRHVYLTE